MSLKISYSYTLYFTTLVFSIGFESIRCDEALLFDKKGYILVQKPLINNVGSENICEHCIAACPAFTHAELKYNYKESSGKKVLFMEIIYNQFVNFNEIELPECPGVVQPSIVFNTSEGLLQTGYEIHDRNSINKSTRNKLLSLYPSKPKKKPNPLGVLSKYSNSRIIAQSSIWLPVLSIDLNIDTLSPMQIEYNPGSGMHLWRENCNNFDFGKEFYTEDPFNFYWEKTQTKLFTGFTGFEDQPATSAQIKPVLSEGEFDCGQKYGCLVQHQIIPSYYLHSSYGALASCTYLNTVPVWKSIVERINIVNKYLYVMTQLWKPNIHLIYSFFEVFTPSEKYFDEMLNPGRPLYLDQQNNRISVPMIIYTIVEYKIITPPPEDTADYYFAVIVIHNDPTPNAGLYRICTGDDRISSWEDIENEEQVSGITYVCGFNKNVAEKLNMRGKENMRDRSPLTLDEFPTFDAVTNSYSYLNVKSEINEKFKQLFENEEFN